MKNIRILAIPLFTILLTACVETAPETVPQETADGSKIIPIETQVTKDSIAVTEKYSPDETATVFTPESVHTTTQFSPETEYTTPETMYAISETLCENTETNVPDTTEQYQETAQTIPVQETTAQVSTTDFAETTTAAVTETIPAVIPELSDYEKAWMVYEDMLENGYGTCVNYACQTYEKCLAIGLPCYLVWTDAGINGHVANTVCVDGIWYILDTQGEKFLSYDPGFTEVIDMEQNRIGGSEMLSDVSYSY